MKYQLLFLMTLIAFIKSEPCPLCSDIMNEAQCYGACAWANGSCDFLGCDGQGDFCLSEGNRPNNGSTLCYTGKNGKCLEFRDCINVSLDFYTNEACQIGCVASEDKLSCIDAPKSPKCSDIEEVDCEGSTDGGSETSLCYVVEDECTSFDATMNCDQYKNQDTCVLGFQNCRWKGKSCIRTQCEDFDLANCRGFYKNPKLQQYQACTFNITSKMCEEKDISELDQPKCRDLAGYTYNPAEKACERCSSQQESASVLLVIGIVLIVVFVLQL